MMQASYSLLEMVRLSGSLSHQKRQGAAWQKAAIARQEVFDDLEIADLARTRTGQGEGEGRPPAANPVRKRR
jgi:hypothetical protein